MERRLDEHKVAFVSCVSDEAMYEEERLYIEHLEVPPGMEVELLKIEQAASMTGGYEQARLASDAKYKIYLHQDVLLLKKDLLPALLDFFRRHPQAGLVGLAGCRRLPPNMIWWDGDETFIGVPQTVEPDQIYRPELPVPEVQVEAVDGVFMAVQNDVPWRSDLFGGWHFYDISASLEQKRHGYEVWIAEQQSYWLLHMTKRPILGSAYQHWRQVCQQEYRDLVSLGK